MPQEEDLGKDLAGRGDLRSVRTLAAYHALVGGLGFTVGGAHHHALRRLHRHPPAKRTVKSLS